MAADGTKTGPRIRESSRPRAVGGELDRSFRLKPGEEIAAGMTRIAAGRADEALARLRGIESGGDAAEAIHGARKDLKKLRAVLRLLRRALPEDLRREENGRYRDAGRALSASRDAEVRLATLEELGERAELPVEALEAWRAILARDREAAAGTAREEAAIAEAVGLIEAGRAGIENWQLEGDSWKLIDPGLRRTYRRGRRAMGLAAKHSGEADFHAWRKRAKDLWYALRILEQAWPRPLGATADEAHRLSEALGDHHDLALLRADLGRRRLGEEETRTLARAIDGRQQQLASEALDLGRRLYVEKPKALTRRLRDYWRAWRG
jgi:CHAD domain-containing protein